jgi:antitoxin HigA-1
MVRSGVSKRRLIASAGFGLATLVTWSCETWVGMSSLSFTTTAGSRSPTINTAGQPIPSDEPHPKEIGVPARRVNEIVQGQRRISADTALRLARFFGTSERFWINLQSRNDLEVEKDRLGDGLNYIRPLTAAS